MRRGVAYYISHSLGNLSGLCLCLCLSGNSKKTYFLSPLLSCFFGHLSFLKSALAPNFSFFLLSPKRRLQTTDDSLLVSPSCCSLSCLQQNHAITTLNFKAAASQSTPPMPAAVLYISPPTMPPTKSATMHAARTCCRRSYTLTNSHTDELLRHDSHVLSKLAQKS